MAIITLPKRHALHAASGAALNRAHPLARGMVVCVSAHDGAGPIADLVKSGRFAATRSPTRLVTPRGAGARWWTFTEPDTADLNWSSGAWTAAVYTYIEAAAANGENRIIFGRVNYVNESSNQGWSLIWAAPDNGTRFGFSAHNNNGGASYFLGSTTTWAAGNSYFVVGTSDATTRRIYLNGVEEANTTNSPVPASQTTNGLINQDSGFGADTGSGSTGKAHVLIAYAWNRELSAAEIRALSDDPFQVLKYPNPLRAVAMNVPPVIPLDSYEGRVQGLPHVERLEVVAF